LTEALSHQIKEDLWKEFDAEVRKKNGSNGFPCRL